MSISSRRAFVMTPLGALGLVALRPFAVTVDAAGPGTTVEPPPITGIAGFLKAVHDGDLEVVRNAIRADPGLARARDERGRSAFAIAHLAGHAAIGDLIREAGYRPDITEAALVGDWERFAALAAEAPGLVNRDHPIGGTAMHAAARGGAGSEIWRVYQYGGDPNARPAGVDAQTPVQVALDHPDLGTAEMTAATLLGNGGDPRAATTDVRTPLHQAAARGSADIVEMLVRRGADVEARDRHGRRPVDVAASDAIAEMLERHLDIPREHSTSRDAYDVNGDPYEAPDLASYAQPLRFRVVGASHFDLDTVRGIVDRHPELASSVATTTERAVEASAHMGRHPIVEYLLGKGAPYSLPTAVMRGDLERVRFLLDEDPRRIDERGAHDFALLWYPVIGGGHIEIAELLLARGARIERQHFMGTTALHWAAIRGQVEMAALLIEHGANVSRVGRKFDPAGETPLALAERGGRDDVARLLRQNGAGA